MNRGSHEIRVAGPRNGSGSACPYRKPRPCCRSDNCASAPPSLCPLQYGASPPGGSPEGDRPFHLELLVLQLAGEWDGVFRSWRPPPAAPATGSTTSGRRSTAERTVRESRSGKRSRTRRRRRSSLDRRTGGVAAELRLFRPRRWAQHESPPAATIWAAACTARGPPLGMWGMIAGKSKRCRIGERCAVRGRAGKGGTYARG